MRVTGDRQGPSTHARRRARRHRAPGQELSPSGRAGTRTRKGKAVENDEGLERQKMVASPVLMMSLAAGGGEHQPRER